LSSSRHGGRPAWLMELISERIGPPWRIASRAAPLSVAGSFLRPARQDHLDDAAT
jgi:hypothetical protein